MAASCVSAATAAAAFAGANARFCNATPGTPMVLTSVANATVHTIALFVATCVSTAPTQSGGGATANNNGATYALTPQTQGPEVLLPSVPPRSTWTSPPLTPNTTVNVAVSAAPPANATTTPPWLYSNDAVLVVFTPGDGTTDANRCVTAFIPGNTPSGTVIRTGAVDLLVTYAAAGGVTLQLPPDLGGAAVPNVVQMMLTFRAPPLYVFAYTPGQQPAAWAQLRVGGDSVVRWLSQSTKKNIAAQDTGAQLFGAGALKTFKSENWGYVALDVADTTSALVVTVDVLQEDVPTDIAATGFATTLGDSKYPSTTFVTTGDALAAAPPGTWFGGTSDAPDTGLLLWRAVSASAKAALDIAPDRDARWLYFRAATHAPTLASYVQDVCFAEGFDDCRRIGSPDAPQPPRCKGFFDAAPPSKAGNAAAVGLVCRRACARSQTTDLPARAMCTALTRAACDAPDAGAKPECACQRLDDSSVETRVVGQTLTWAGFKKWFASTFPSPADAVKILSRHECWWPTCDTDSEYGALPSATLAGCPQQMRTCFAAIQDVDVRDSTCVNVCVRTKCDLESPSNTVELAALAAGACDNQGCGDMPTPGGGGGGGGGDSGGGSSGGGSSGGGGGNNKPSSKPRGLQSWQVGLIVAALVLVIVGVVVGVAVYARRRRGVRLPKPSR